MTALFIGNEPSLNGTTWVTAGAAPAGGKQRQILSCMGDNIDTADHVFSSRKNKAGVFVNYSDVLIAAGQRAQLISNSVVLDDTDETYEVKNEATASTTPPKLDLAIFEVP